MIFAISDLHLPGGTQKPMDVFGAHWAGHFDKIAGDWCARVCADDIVLLPGDLSWAMQLADAQPDLDAVGALPGRKVLLRGNHDYWWSAIGRLRAALPQGMYALQNDAVDLGEAILCGSRGWVVPAPATDAGDIRIYRREVARLALSLQKAEALQRARGGQGRLIAMLHYPPFGERAQATEVTALLTRYGVTDAVYGHLHGPGLAGAFTGTLDGVRYHLTSCDGLQFRLLALAED